MTRRGILFTGLVGLIVLGAVLLYIYGFEEEEVEIWTGPTGPARTNEFHAADRFMDEMGVPTRSERRLVDGPPEDVDLILFLDPNRRPSALRAEQLRTWVRAGGHLVVVAMHPRELERGKQDPLLEYYGISVWSQWNRYGWAADTPEKEEEEPKIGFEEPVILECPPHLPDWSVTRDEGLRALSFEEGDGRITVLVESGMFKSDRIGEPEHARFLWTIVSLTDEPPERGLLIHSDEFPGLLTLIGENGGPVLAGLGALLVVWLWGASRRFGPLLPERDPTRRSLLEHIDAAGSFLWRQGDQGALVESVREALKKRIRRRRPDLAHLANKEQIDALAEEASLPADAVRDALLGAAPVRADAFTRTVSLLERLRRRL